jgi:acyl-CoA thioester hydrolase
MEKFIQPVNIRWSDLDPNFHLRHSVYYDWGAYARIGLMGQLGINTSLMQELHIGPIIFREECQFRREIKLDDPATISTQVLKSRKDFSRWTFVHTIYKNPETVAAILTVDGAWMDTEKRKLTIPPVEVVKAFTEMPFHADFAWSEK